MKVIIAGTRGFSDYTLLCKKCDYYLSNQLSVEVVSGTARGADTLGEKYASERGFEVTRFPADWGKYGRRAGYIRNEEMAAYADALIAFWDGKSPGTNSMIAIARSAGLKVAVIRY